MPLIVGAVRRTFAAGDVSFNVIICYPAVVCLPLGDLLPQGALFRDAHEQINAASGLQSSSKTVASLV